jgi:hypothetical protein
MMSFVKIFVGVVFLSCLGAVAYIIAPKIYATEDREFNLHVPIFEATYNHYMNTGSVPKKVPDHESIDLYWDSEMLLDYSIIDHPDYIIIRHHVNGDSFIDLKINKEELI